MSPGRPEIERGRSNRRRNPRILREKETTQKTFCDGLMAYRYLEENSQEIFTLNYFSWNDEPATVDDITTFHDFVSLLTENGCLLQFIAVRSVSKGKRLKDY